MNIQAEIRISFFHNITRCILAGTLKCAFREQEGLEVLGDKTLGLVGHLIRADAN